jgi:hypothetical protein
VAQKINCNPLQEKWIGIAAGGSPVFFNSFGAWPALVIMVDNLREQDIRIKAI